MSGAIAICVKTPGLSPVKTRLATTVGTQNAQRFHLAAAKAITQVVQATAKQNNIKGYFAVAESSALHHIYWQDLPCIWQGDGGLGERMAHIYQQLLVHHDFVILVGADIPQMTTTHLLEASAGLAYKQHVQLVFAPSYDGGFWLFGGNCNIPSALWTNVAYSTQDTGRQFLTQMEQVGHIKKLTPLRDIDEFKDLLPLYQCLLGLNKLLPAQQALITFLQTILG